MTLWRLKVSDKVAFLVLLTIMMLCKSFVFKKLQRTRLRQLTSAVSNSGDTNIYPNFSFTVHKSSRASNARLGTIVTPHGEVSTPNFIFCGTKATMKALSPAQMREANAQIMLSNTYHLMLTPGPDIIEKMGGLQKFSGWNGPMLTDSGGYQIFSMGFGSVSNEMKGKRLKPSGENMNGNEQTLLKLTENGATFKSFYDGSIHELTPEKSIQIQRKLGADLIVVLDECTPFNVDKNYTEQSMLRSHRWGDRSLAEFILTGSSDSKYFGRQALYGIVQGGVHKDLRDLSCAYVNSRTFFGTAIGGSLGNSRECMYDIVAYTRARVREDRPVHLLGIGGVRDIFHGVRCGIDTFDCVHPSRLGRHGGALVLAGHWDESGEEKELLREEQEEEEDVGDGVSDAERVGVVNRWKRMLNAEEQQQLTYFQKQPPYRQRVIVEHMESLPPPEVKILKHGGQRTRKSYASITQQIRQHFDGECANLTRALDESGENESLSSGSGGGQLNDILKLNKRKKKALPSVRINENIHLTNGRYRQDPRPIDATCGCYTCRPVSQGGGGFSRAYLNHLFKVDESLGGTLVTLHNVYFMNRLMKDIREGIKNDNLDEVEKMYIHPKLENV